MTIYDRDGLRVDTDEDSVSFFLYDVLKVQMTRDEFESLVDVYFDEDL